MNPPSQPLRPRCSTLAVPGWIGVALLLILTWSLCETAAWADGIRYRIQPEATEVSFRATSRLMNAEGRFNRVSGEVTVDPQDFSAARITLSIEAGSIDTGIGMRDSHLRSEDFFDVKKYPAITFESQRVEGSGRRANVYGQLTIHGVTREIAVPVEVALSDIALTAKGEFVVNRRDYGMNYDSFINPVGNDVRVQFTFRARSG
jgi:polyisoprenoid-binding protein YceI